MAEPIIIQNAPISNYQLVFRDTFSPLSETPGKISPCNRGKLFADPAMTVHPQQNAGRDKGHARLPKVVYRCYPNLTQSWMICSP